MPDLIKRKTNTLPDFEQDKLRFMAEEYVDNPDLSFNTIKDYEITSEFWEAIKRYYKQRTNIVFNFNGHTTDGKSITCATIIAKINKEYFNREMKAKYILGNQQEYSYWVNKNPNETELMLQIDEFSNLAGTGENSSIETQFLEEISNIHAQTYIGRGYCSPKAIGDPNCLFHLEVAHKDIDGQFNVCYVYYNLTRGGTSYPQIIGHIIVDVSETLKSQWYKEYREKKFQKIDLLRIHKIYHERDLIYAGAIRETIEYFNEYLSMNKVPDADEIKNIGKTIAEKKGIRLSIIGTQLTIVDNVRPILKTKLDFQRISNQIITIQNKEKRNKIEEKALEDSVIMKKKLLETISMQMAELKRKEKLFDIYKDI